VLIDSTNDTLSHELIEAITDPDLDAWWNSIGFGMFGEEIADECLFADGPATFRGGLFSAATTCNFPTPLGARQRFAQYLARRVNAS
jgi:hypothetical protein